CSYWDEQFVLFPAVEDHDMFLTTRVNVSVQELVDNCSVQSHTSLFAPVYFRLNLSILFSLLPITISFLLSFLLSWLCHYVRSIFRFLLTVISSRNHRVFITQRTSTSITSPT